MNLLILVCLLCVISWAMGWIQFFLCANPEKSKGKTFVCDNLGMVQSLLSCAVCVLLIVMMVRGGMGSMRGGAPVV